MQSSQRHLAEMDAKQQGSELSADKISQENSSSRLQSMPLPQSQFSFAKISAYCMETTH